MFLPCDHSYLRASVTQRPSYYVSRYEKLSRDVEYDVTRLLELEIDLHNRGERLRQQLESRHDWSMHGCWRSVDLHNDGYIDAVNLRAFFRRNDYYPTEAEVVALIRRLDTDSDAKLSYTEFSEGIRTQEPYSASLSRQLENERRDRLARSMSADKRDRDYLANSLHSSPLKSSIRSQYTSPARPGSAASFSPAKSYASPAKPTSKLSPMRLEEEDELVRALRDQIALEKDIETAKIDLTLKHDFNLHDAFWIFDTNANGWISHSELKFGLNDLGIYPTTEETDLFFKRYDKDQDGRLRFSEFS